MAAAVVFSCSPRDAAETSSSSPEESTQGALVAAAERSEGCDTLTSYLRGPDSSDAARVGSASQDLDALVEALTHGRHAAEGRQAGEPSSDEPPARNLRGRLNVLWDNLRDSDYEAFLERAERQLANVMGPISNRSSAASALARSGPAGFERLADVASSLHSRDVVDIVIESALPRAIVRPLSAKEIFFGEGTYCGRSLSAPGCQELGVDLLVVEPDLLAQWTEEGEDTSLGDEDYAVLLAAAEAAVLRSLDNAEQWTSAVERAAGLNKADAAMASLRRLGTVGLPPEALARARFRMARAGSYSAVLFETALWNGVSQLSIADEVAPYLLSAWERSVEAGRPDAYSGALAVWVAGSTESVDVEQLSGALTRAIRSSRGAAAMMMSLVLAKINAEATVERRSSELQLGIEAVRTESFAELATWIEAQQPSSQLGLMAAGAWRIDRPAELHRGLSSPSEDWRATAWEAIYAAHGSEHAQAFGRWVTSAEREVVKSESVWALRELLAEDASWISDRQDVVSSGADPQRVREALVGLRIIGVDIPSEVLFRLVKSARPERRGGLDRPHTTAFLALAAMAEQGDAPPAIEVITSFATRSVAEFGARELSLAAWLAAAPCIQ